MFFTYLLFLFSVGPLTVTMSNDAVFYEDKPTDITCMSTGSRPPEEFTFYVNNELVNTSSTLYSFTPNGTYDVRSTLTFSPDRKHHKGTVSCQVFNRSSQSVISKYQTMEVYCKYPNFQTHIIKFIILLHDTLDKMS